MVNNQMIEALLAQYATYLCRMGHPQLAPPDDQKGEGQPSSAYLGCRVEPKYGRLLRDRRLYDTYTGSHN